MSLIVNGTTLPEPAIEGVTITSEKVWSDDTGRVSTGEMVGTLVAIKRKVSIKWPTLTQAQASTIENAVSSMSRPWSTMSYTDMGGNTTSMTCYFGTPTYTRYSDASGKLWITSCSVDGIEK